MANALKITITAADRATQILNNMNKRMSRLTRPFQDMERSLQRFSKAAGFGMVKEKLQGLMQSAGRVAKAFAKVGAPLIALVGGGTIAGLAALTSGWAKFGLHLSQTAQILGLNTQNLYDFQNAARLVGISGQTATAAFQGFADTIQDAFYGRNQQAMSIFLGLGMHLKKTQTGSLDAMDALGQVADKIHQFQQTGHSGAARTLARQLGLSSILPVLMQGRKALEDYEAQSRKLAGTMNWKQAAAAATQWMRLDVAMEGTKNTIAAALLPTITPLVTQFGSWISANRQLIATKIGDFVKGLAQAFKGLSLKTVLDDILAIVKGALKLVTETASLVSHLGGLKRVLEGLAVVWAVPKVVSFSTGLTKIAMGATAASKAMLAWRAARVAAKGGALAEGAAGAGAFATTAAVGGAAALGVGAGWALDKYFPNNPLAKLGGWIGRSIYDRTHRAQTAMDYFQSQGWTRAQSAGIAANIERESGFDPGAVGDRGRARGIGQWHADRQANFNAWAARNRLPDLEHAGLLEQLQFYDYELRHSHAGTRLKGAKSAYDAGAIVSLYGERPADAQGEAAKRGALAAQLAGSASPPVVNVAVKNTIHRDGSATTRVSTPSGVKIVHTSPVEAVS